MGKDTVNSDGKGRCRNPQINDNAGGEGSGERRGDKSIKASQFHIQRRRFRFDGVNRSLQGVEGIRQGIAGGRSIESGLKVSLKVVKFSIRNIGIFGWHQDHHALRTQGRIDDALRSRNHRRSFLCRCNLDLDFGIVTQPIKAVQCKELCSGHDDLGGHGDINNITQIRRPDIHRASNNGQHSKARERRPRKQRNGVVLIRKVERDRSRARSGDRRIRVIRTGCRTCNAKRQIANPGNRGTISVFDGIRNIRRRRKGGIQRIQRAKLCHRQRIGQRRDRDLCIAKVSVRGQNGFGCVRHRHIAGEGRAKLGQRFEVGHGQGYRRVSHGDSRIAKVSVRGQNGRSRVRHRHVANIGHVEIGQRFEIRHGQRQSRIGHAH